MQEEVRRFEECEGVYYKDRSLFSSWRGSMAELQRLKEEPIGSASDLERFVLRLNELCLGIFGRVTDLYLASAARPSLLRLARFGIAYRRVTTKLLRVKSDIEQRILSDAHVSLLPKERYGWYLELIRNAGVFSSPAVLRAEADDERRRGKHNSIFGGIRVRYRGERMPIRKLERRLSEPDPKQREEAWRLAQTAIMRRKPKIDALATGLIESRDRMARGQGFSNYREYMQRKKARFSYSLEDLARFRDAVVRWVVPIAVSHDRERAKGLGQPSLRPWDTRVGGAGEHLPPYHGMDDWLDRLMRVFHRIDPAFGEVFGKMRGSGYLDLDLRPRKLSVGFTIPVPRTHGAFISLNADTRHPTFQDCIGAHHEFGHAAHFAMMGHIPVFDYVYQFTMPGEIMELASFSMELLAMDAYDEYLSDPAQIKAARGLQMSRMLDMLATAAGLDAFEDWVYTHPTATVGERDQAFLRINEAFAPSIDWSGVEEFRPLVWMRLPHLFILPCYFVEYALAGLGALQLYAQAQAGRGKAVAALKDALALGYSHPVAELYAAAGLRFDLSEAAVRHAAELLERELS